MGRDTAIRGDVRAEQGCDEKESGAEGTKQAWLVQLLVLSLLGLCCASSVCGT